MANMEKYPLFGIPNAVTVDATPIPLDDATRELYQRAVADPSSITDAEMRTITLRPPPAQEDELCREKCDLPFDAVVQKALRGDKLTYDEAEAIKLGVRWKQKTETTARQLRQPPEDRELRYAAVEAVTPQSLKDARVIAQPVYAAAGDAASAAVLEYYQGSEMLQIKRALMTPWQAHILAQGHGGACGLVLFHPRRAAAARWDAFRARMDLAVHHGLRAKAGGVKAPIIDGFALHLVETTGESSGGGGGEWQETFKELRDAGAVPPGLRTDAFLYVDDEALASVDGKRPFAWLWEPQDTEHGPLRVELNSIVPLLMARLTQRDLEGDARTKPFRHGPELAALHKAASYARSDDMIQIWPPDPRAT
ncbi:hypothetical protein CCM_00316 [Cordyceps militaris CM01]|uniref:Uncharacterized protein n=1 Tax=Cordyceps militaris (strain CM01) TaxID=983644 RepID=G3J3D2_CORMM|nr:uncharacterized protein CCM_00316 [Cordyceps militaris CM01]EGX95662.1 hypothetical protein CCM_00316 [Cordyceps militaris CM01]